MHEIKRARDLAVDIRNRMDTYLGRELPKEFRTDFMAMCNDEKCRKKIFKGTDFSATFKEVLRGDRLQLLKKILEEEGFYD